MNRDARARLAGAVAAGVALGTGELVSAFGEPGQTLVGSVANEIVDRAAGGLVRWAIGVFGTADKAALVIGIVVLSLAIGAWVGRQSLRRPWVNPVAFGSFGLVGLLSGVSDPLADHGIAVAAAVAAAVAGSATLWVLLRIADAREILPMATTQTVTRPVERPGDDRASRRAFFGWAGAAGAFAVTAALAAKSLKDQSRVEATRQQIALPRVARPAQTIPATGVEVEGITPYIVPNDSFYRIDTALVVPQVDVSSWKLSVTGMVDHPFELTFDELLAMPMVEEAVTLSCVSNEVGGRLVGNAVWQGVPLTALLDRAGVQPDASQIVGVSVDDFTAGFPTDAVRDGRVALVAVGMNGEPLPVTHGFPARLVVAGLYGYVSATKWLKEIRLTTWDGFDGYWVPRGWAKRAPIKTQSRIDVPRSGEQLSPGPNAIAGVAWAPTRGISKVEVQVDDGPWMEARLGDTLSDDTWVQWLVEWDATPGDHVLRVRATDGAGDTQTAEQAPPDPDGATGWHTRRVSVAG